MVAVTIEPAPAASTRSRSICLPRPAAEQSLWGSCLTSCPGRLRHGKLWASFACAARPRSHLKRRVSCVAPRPGLRPLSLSAAAWLACRSLVPAARASALGFLLTPALSGSQSAADCAGALLPLPGICRRFHPDPIFSSWRARRRAGGMMRGRPSSRPKGGSIK